ncbi:MAG TPA: hypothetical protein PLT74_01865 [Kiritimatiellia bacterium]|jgi:hypothetical protein|nr:MAG: hypothetical protein BWX70_01093 [Verrucomicrobia bacterium ADurb.Bin070]HPB09979.1 hypothetical protein [Kiritimatiellia bacterium]HQL51277.1 hypothetical protein [Kiritimatiellia bacterium]
MLTVILNAGFGVLVLLAFGMSGAANWGWSVFWGVVAFAAGQVAAGFLIQRRVKAGMAGVQKILEDGQKRLQAKVNQWQTRPPGSLKQAQIEIEREQRVFVERALEASKEMERFNRWAPLMGRQLATMRLQLYWMLKDFKRVDELMPTALVIDPMMAAIKMARMHMKGEEGIEKLFKKQSARVRYGQGALLYGLYSWILVQKNDLDGAHKVLIQACEKMENETLKRNREHLANNRVGHFSNAGMGDEWYALHLEQPKVKMQRQRPNAFGRPF